MTEGIISGRLISDLTFDLGVLSFPNVTFGMNFLGIFSRQTYFLIRRQYCDTHHGCHKIVTRDTDTSDL